MYSLTLARFSLTCTINATDRTIPSMRGLSNILSQILSKQPCQRNISKERLKHTDLYTDEHTTQYIQCAVSHLYMLTDKQLDDQNHVDKQTDRENNAKTRKNILTTTYTDLYNNVRKKMGRGRGLNSAPVFNAYVMSNAESR